MQPPKFLYQLFTFCCPKDRPDLLGDFLEWYEEEVEEKAKWKVNWEWFINSLSLLPLKWMTRNKTKTQSNKIFMFKTYFKIGRRNLMKNKVYSLINILGLAVGLAAFTLIAVFVYDETNYDRHFPDYERIYRIAGEYDQGGDAKVISAETTFLLPPTLEDNFNQDITFTRLDFRSALVRIDDQHYWENDMLAADSTFFQVFGVKWVSGKAEVALQNPKGMVIDQSTAKKYFGFEDALGKTVQVEDEYYEVTGVIADLPSNTHFTANIFIPIHGIVDNYPDWVRTNSTGTSHLTYCKVPEDLNMTQFAASINKIISPMMDKNTPPRYFFQSIQDIHLKSDLTAEIGINGSETTVYIFLATALAILLLACINYVNLSIAGALQRSMEVGIKKVLGASKRSQVFQFQAEAILIGLIASIVSVLFVELTLPYFNHVTGKDFSFSLVHDLLIGLSLFSLTFILSLITGSFPALFLLKMPTKNSLTKTQFTRNREGFSMRNVLVSIQFFLAAILIASTVIIVQQIYFMRNKDLGINSEHLVMIPFQTNEVFNKYETIKEELLKQSAIISVSATNNNVTNRVGHWRNYQLPNKEEGFSCPTVIVGHDFFQTMGAELMEGRAFSEKHKTDAKEAYVINEAAAKFFELENPLGADLSGAVFTGSQWDRKKAKIIGVVKNFHFASLHSKIRPAVFSLNSDITWGMDWMLVKISGEDIPKTIDFLEETWGKFESERPFRYNFMDEEINQHYQSEDRLLSVLLTFTLLSVFIGCLGLYGLTAFLMKRRTKEIGIRKVLGASLLELISELSKDFLKLVLIANLVGIPFAFWLMKGWLENFAYQTPLSIFPFVFTGLGALAIAFLSIVYHSIKVANNNPVESIQYE